MKLLRISGWLGNLLTSSVRSIKREGGSINYTLAAIINRIRAACKLMHKNDSITREQGFWSLKNNKKCEMENDTQVAETPPRRRTKHRQEATGQSTSSLVAKFSLFEEKQSAPLLASIVEPIEGFVSEQQDKEISPNSTPREAQVKLSQPGECSILWTNIWTRIFLAFVISLEKVT